MQLDTYRDVKLTLWGMTCLLMAVAFASIGENILAAVMFTSTVVCFAIVRDMIKRRLKREHE